MVGEQTSKLAEADIVFRLVDKVRVKGKQIETAIYQPMGRRKDLSDAADKQIRQFESARAEYEGGQVRRGLAGFRRLPRQISRTRRTTAWSRFTKSGWPIFPANPPTQWDGITVFEEK